MDPQRAAINSQTPALAHPVGRENPLLKAGELVYGTALSLCHVLLRIAGALLLLVSPLIAFAAAIMFFDLLMAMFHQVQRLLTLP